jgi:hypothetical protein
VCNKEKGRWSEVKVIKGQEVAENVTLYTYFVTNWRIIRAMVALHNLYPSNFALSLGALAHGTLCSQINTDSY